MAELLWVFLLGALTCGLLLGILIGLLISGSKVNRLIALAGRRKSVYRKLSDEEDALMSVSESGEDEEQEDKGEELKMALCVRTGESFECFLRRDLFAEKICKWARARCVLKLVMQA